jgi:translocation and assembly module TamB
MRRAKISLLTLAVLLCMAGTGNCSMFSFFTNWGGSYLLSLIQGEVNGKVTAAAISGNPLSGVTYKNFAILNPDGTIFMAAERLEVRLSLSSLISFYLDVGNLALIKPRIYLSQAKSGQWNVGTLVKKKPQPTKLPGLLEKILAYFFREIKLSNLVVQQGELLLTSGGVTKRYPNLDLISSLTLLQVGQPQQQITMEVPTLGITTPQGRAELETRLAYGSGVAKIKGLHLKLAGQPVASVQGEICRPLDDLTCTLTGRIGPLAGSKIHGFWSQWPAPWDLSGAFSLSSTPQGGKIDLQGKIGQADYTVRGDLNATVKPAVFALDMDLQGLTTAQLQELKGIKVGQLQGLSPVSAHLHLEGTGLPWDPKSLNTHLELQPFRYREIKVDKAALDLSGNARQQALQVSVAGNFGAVNLSADGHLLPLGETGQGLFGDLTFQTTNLQPERVGVTKLPGTALTSRFTGKFRVPASPSLSQTYLAGNLGVSGQINNRPLQNLSASFVLERRNLTISQAEVQSAGLTASVHGALSESGINLAFNAAAAGSRALPLPPGQTFASLKARGEVRGPWKALQVNLAAQAEKLSFRNFSLQSANLKANLEGWPPRSGSLELCGSQLGSPAGKFSQLNFQATGGGGQWQFQVAATSPKAPRFELAGSAALAARPFTLQVTRVSWHSCGLTVKNQAPFQVRMLPGWEITPALFQIDGGRVTLVGQARDQELSGRLEVRDLNAGLLAPLGLSAQGQLNGALTLAGNPRAPEINGQLALTAGMIKDFPIQALTTSLSYRNDQAQISGYLEIGSLHSRLIWKGSVPVQLSLLPFKVSLAKTGLDLRMHSERFNLSQLSAITSEVERAAGALELAVTAQGNPLQPRVLGYVRWSAGSILLRQAGTPYSLEAGEIRLQGDRIVIPGLVLKSNGTLSLTGDIVLARSIQVHSRVQAENFRLLNRGGNELVTDGAIDVDGPLAALVAKGRLTVPKAQFHPTFFQTGQDPDVILVPQKAPSKIKGTAPDFYRAMRVNVVIEAPNNVWLKDPLGQVELTAYLKALKEPEQKLAMSGEIRALHGTLDVEGNVFKVERAVLTLPGVAGKPIVVDAKATHPVSDADITIEIIVIGTITNPQIHLESIPPLPPADVLSYLVFGAPAATLTRDQYLTFAAQYGLLGGGAKLGEILGSTIPFLSGVRVKSGMVSGRPSVGLEKKVAKNVSIFVGRNFNEERGEYEQQVGIQYKVNKHVSVESQVGTRNSGADVYFNYDF